MDSTASCRSTYTWENSSADVLLTHLLTDFVRTAYRSMNVAAKPTRMGLYYKIVAY